MSESRSEHPDNPTVMGTGDAVGVPPPDVIEPKSEQRKWLIAPSYIIPHTSSLIHHPSYIIPHT